jgi:beta-galactosidase
MVERWQDERVFGVNREPAHAPLRAYEDVPAAHAAQVLNGDAPPPSRWLKPLTPSAWAFNLARTPASAPRTQLDLGFDTSDWGVLDVPLSLEAAGYGQAQYTNVRYPFPLQPPHIPEEGNHVGSYQTTFELPNEWRGRRVLLEFDGTGPAATVWLNGREVGYTQDWALPAEFDLTRLLAGSISRRTHVLSVQVMRWCDGSYLEGQDQWWFSGIHRHVCASSATTHERGSAPLQRRTARTGAPVQQAQRSRDLRLHRVHNERGDRRRLRRIGGHGAAWRPRCPRGG